MIHLEQSLLAKLAAFSGDDMRYVTAYGGLFVDAVSLTAGTETSFCRIKCLNAVNYGKLQLIPNYVIQGALIAANSHDKIIFSDKSIYIPKRGMRIEYEPVKLLPPDFEEIFDIPVRIQEKEVPFTYAMQETLRDFGLLNDCAVYGLSKNKQYLRFVFASWIYQIDFAFAMTMKI